MDRLMKTRDFLRTSFWFVPILMTLSGLTMIVMTIFIEKRLTDTYPKTPWYLYAGSPGDAMSILSAILSSMITMASLVFSITMVVLTLAASQFGPRLIRNFMGNLRTQIVLGAFVMTGVYCLLALPALDLRQSPGKSAYVSVTVALFLAFASIVLLVIFIDNLARSIVSETVIERVGDELDELLGKLRPLQTGKKVEISARQAAKFYFEQDAAFLGTSTAGYVQAIEFGKLVDVAQKADVVIALHFRSGHYVVPGAREIGVYPRGRFNQVLAEKIQSAIIVGVHRTPIQDPDFSIHHLDEIATRALSPAVNDPYTAVAVIDRLSASLCKLMSRTLPSGVFRDGRQDVRVVSTEPSYAGLIGAAFNQIRQNGTEKPIIVLHLLEAIERIAQHVRLPVQHAALSEQAAAIMEAARRQIDSGLDRECVEERYIAALQSLAHAAKIWET